MELPSWLRPRLKLWSSCGIQPEKYKTRVDEWGAEVELDLIVQNAALTTKNGGEQWP